MPTIQEALEAEGDPIVEVEGAATAPPESGGSDVVGQTEVEGNPPEPTSLDVAEYGNHMVPIKVDGETKLVPLAEAIEGYQRTADYTRKTQELAAQRAEAEGALVLQRALQANPAATLRLLTEQYGVTEANRLVAEAQGDVVEDPYANDPLAQRLSAVESFAERYELQQTEAQLASTLSGLQAKYGDDFDPNAVVNAAIAGGVTDFTKLEGVYQQMAFQRIFATQQAQAQAAAASAADDAQRQAAAADATNSIESVTHGAASAAAAATPVNSVLDAYRLAKSQLGES